MRNFALSRKDKAGRYSHLATDEDEYIAPATKARGPVGFKLKDHDGSLRSYIDNLDNPDNQVFQRFFQTTVNVACMWGLAFYYMFPETRVYIGGAFAVCCLIAIKLTWL